MKGKALFLLTSTIIFLLFISLSVPRAASAQDTLSEPTPQPLLIYTSYPDQVIGFGEAINFPLKVRGGTPQLVKLELKDLPQGWEAFFRGGAQVIESVFLNGVTESSVDLRLEPPEDVQAGEYEFQVMANGEAEKSALKIHITIKEKLPPSMSLTVDGLATKQGKPTSTFNFTAVLRNEGGEDLLVSLSATRPENMEVTIKEAGQEVNEVQLPANATKNLTIQAEPLITLATGKYPFTVTATAGEVRTELELVVEVVGEGTLSISAPDGRLSATAYAGKQNPLKIILENTGTASLLGVELSSSEPGGWSIVFDQPKIAEIQAGQTVEVSAQITPPEKAIAGDYLVTIYARPLDSKQQSAQFRITVQTSTLWGIAGIGLIALAVGVVGLAVTRFGRR